jgi:hypothetical protein
MEVVLWLLLIVPGLMYSLWRLTTRAKVCPKCGAPYMIPTNSPKAIKTLARRVSIDRSHDRKARLNPHVTREANRTARYRRS